MFQAALSLRHPVITVLRGERGRVCVRPPPPGVRCLRSGSPARGRCASCTHEAEHASVAYFPADRRFAEQADGSHSQPREVVVVIISESRSLRKTVSQKGG